MKKDSSCFFLKEYWLCYCLALLCCPFLSKNKFFSLEFILKLISNEDYSISSFKDFIELMNAINSIYFSKQINAASMLSKPLSYLLAICGGWNEWDCQKVDHCLLRNGYEIFCISRRDNVQLSVLATCESDAAIWPYGSSNFDIHFDTCFKYFWNYPNYLSVIKIDNVIWF